MTQVLKTQNFLEGFSCIQTFGEDLVLCGVEEQVRIIDQDLNVKHSLKVEMGVVDCKSKEDCKFLKKLIFRPGFVLFG